MSLAAMTNLMAEFGAVIGLPNLAIDEEHRCDLMFDDVAVSFQLGADDESLCIYSLLGRVDADATGSTHAALLRANYAFGAADGAVFSIDADTGGIVLMRAERLEWLRLPRLEAVLEDFVNTAEQWTAQIRAGGIDPGADDRGSEGPLPEPGTLRV